MATAGTPTTLASLQNQTNHWPKLHGVKLNLQQVDKWYQNLLWLSVEERKQPKRYAHLPGRCYACRFKLVKTDHVSFLLEAMCCICYRPAFWLVTPLSNKYIQEEAINYELINNNKAHQSS